jgi:hypothetical protein
VAHTTHDPASTGDIRAAIRSAVAHLGHVLPGQAPIRDFVHHNTLHGYQHLPFPEALRAACAATGNRGYLSAAQFRELHGTGRITRADLEAVLREDAALGAAEEIGRLAAGTLHREDAYLAALLHPIEPVTACQLSWQIEERNALARFQPDVGTEDRMRGLLRAAAQGVHGEGRAVADLWQTTLATLGLEHYLLHPEDLMDLSPEQAERMLAGIEGATLSGAAGPSVVEGLLQREADALLRGLFARVGADLTLRGVLLALTGRDLLDEVRPALLRHLAQHLDLGLAAWRHRDRSRGFYAAWRACALRDPTGTLEDLPDWRDHIESLPDDPLEAVVEQLTRLTLPQAAWCDYLQRLALELPGWSGMFLWRSEHPEYAGAEGPPVDMIDYLAVRLALEHLYAQRLCRRLWHVEASLDLLRWHFRHHRAELLVRHALHNARLPEYLAARAQTLVDRAAEDLSATDEAAWTQLAHLIWTWQQSPAGARSSGHSVFRDGWRLFRAAQHLGLSGADLRTLGRAGAARLLECLDRLDPDRAGFLWLQAYERHYREEILAALAANHGRGRWPDRSERPAAQIVFCMDDREEGIRRHLEVIDPEVETLGAAAHFNVPHAWRGLDDCATVALCPVVPAPVIPAHEVHEIPRAGTEAGQALHARRQGLRQRLAARLERGARAGLLAPALLAIAGMPATLLALAGKTLAPRPFDALLRRLGSAFVPPLRTAIAFVAANDSPPALPEARRLGFTDVEQADRVQALLRNLGLTAGFAPLVAVAGHVSHSQNNPHGSAYNCGACAGRFSGPNARLVCAMANRPPVRALLRERGIAIPDDTWFVGAEHDTCDDVVTWLDTEDVPSSARPMLARLQDAVAQAGLLHAQERCRRFMSAPLDLTPDDAWRHIAGRAADFAQARPELGHATNACAFFGRRAMSRGAFFDRRAFLISYDPAGDADGALLERHLLINGAVGAGISLEYYFSTANNAGYGAGSKVTHNVAGLTGVMEGASSDLRTGLPQQMIEVHEAMRLLVVVEQKIEVLTAIYQRQPPLQELVGNGWVQLAAKDPDSPAIHRFVPGTGWVRWEPPGLPPPLVRRSGDWYLGHRGPRPPVLLDVAEAARA